jgi:hypothetical protein
VQSMCPILFKNCVKGLKGCIPKYHSASHSAVICDRTVLVGSVCVFQIPVVNISVRKYS